MPKTKNALIRQKVIDKCLRSPKFYSRATSGRGSCGSEPNVKFINKTTMILTSMNGEDICLHFETIGAELRARVVAYARANAAKIRKLCKTGMEYVPLKRMECRFDDGMVFYALGVAKYLKNIEGKGSGREVALQLVYAIVNDQNTGKKKLYIVYAGDDYQFQSVALFTTHCIQRYNERFHANRLSFEDACHSFAWNNRTLCFFKTEEKFKDTDHTLLIGRCQDGALFGFINTEEMMFQLNTFVTNEMLFKSQSDINNDSVMADTSYLKDYSGILFYNAPGEAPPEALMACETKTSRSGQDYLVPTYKTSREFDLLRTTLKKQNNLDFHIPVL